jgi:hypothetical protein
VLVNAHATASAEARRRTRAQSSTLPSGQARSRVRPHTRVHVFRGQARSRQAARATAEGRYKKFVEYVAEQFSGGHRFLDDLPKEMVANDVELDEVLAKPDP